AIPRRVAAEARRLVGGDRVGDQVHGDGVGAVDLIEQAPVAVDLADALLGDIVRHAHLDRVLDRALRLLLERARAAVPEVVRDERERAVYERRRLAVALLAVDAGRHRGRLAERVLGAVARRARD